MGLYYKLLDVCYSGCKFWWTSGIIWSEFGTTGNNTDWLIDYYIYNKTTSLESTDSSEKDESNKILM